MKKILFVFVFALISFFAKAEITFDKSAQKLIASLGTSYQWFYNTQKTEVSVQSISIKESGFYTVEYISLDGKSQKESVYFDAQTQTVFRVFIVGDSTVCNYSTDHNHKTYPQAGWGQMLPYFFNTQQVEFDNHAIGGRSTRTFTEQGRWKKITEQLQKGDYVFVQFGHNDRDKTPGKNRYTSVPDYKNYLKQYVNEAREKGAVPILVSPMNMNSWATPTTMRKVFSEADSGYRDGMAQVAKEMKVAFVDLFEKSVNLFQTVGKEYASEFYFLHAKAGEYPARPNGINDNTHFQELGALELTRLVVEGLKELKDEPSLKPLINSMLPTYKVTINANNKGGLVTQSSEYPEGVDVTLRAIPQTNNFIKWVEEGKTEPLSTCLIYRIRMGKTNRNITAIFDTKTLDAASLVTTCHCENGFENNEPLVARGKVSVLYTVTDAQLNAAGADTFKETPEKDLKALDFKLEIQKETIGIRSKETILNVTITNVSNVKVIEKTLKDKSIKLDSKTLVAGWYWATVKTQTQTVYKKFEVKK